MTWWFKKHPELLETECKRLEGNSNYHEAYRKRGNLLLSTGEIIVRTDKVSKHPVLLLYPESYPYALTRVFMLKKVIDEAELSRLCELGSETVAAAIAGNIHFYNYWHQNFDGSLCLLEADNLEKYGEFFSVTQVIGRTRDWLTGFTTGVFPPDSAEIEIFGHFRFKDLSREFLFPEPFYRDDLVQGEFYFSTIAHPYSGPQVNRRIYLGALVSGQTKGGINLPTFYKSQMHLLPPGLRSELDILQKPDLVKKSLESDDMIKCFWWHFEGKVKPFASVSEFVELLGEGDISKGRQRIYDVSKDDFFADSPRVYWALRFLNSRGENQIQAFVLEKVGSKPVLRINDKRLEAFVPLLDNYNIKAIRGEAFNENRFQLRNKGRLDSPVIKKQAVTLLGCGSLGGEIGDCLAKAGVGEMALVDFQSMKYDNAVRHVLGIETTGMAKVHALSIYLKNHNPFLQTYILGYDVLKCDLNQYFINDGIGISSIADDNIECFINEQAVISNRTIFYARALRGGKAARIFKVTPGHDACFFCLSMYADANDARFIKIPTDPTLPTITNECNNPIRPASAADLKLISSLTSRLVLDYMQKPDDASNHWIWCSEQIEGVTGEEFKPFSLLSSHVPPHPECPLCKPEKKISVRIDRNVLKMMQEETKIDSTIETGGILLGSMNQDNIEIRFASGPGPKAIKLATEFIRDKAFCQKFIDGHYRQFGQNAAYVGEWHYHPSANNRPSGTDILSLTNIAGGQGYLTDHPAMIILSDTGSPSCTIHPAKKSYYYVDLEIKT